MAEVSKCAGKGAHDIVLKIYRRYLLESQNKNKKRLVRVSSPSASFLFDDIQYYELNAADKVDVGGSQDSYTRVKQAGLSKESVADNYYNRDLDKHVFSKKIPMKLNEKNLLRYQNYALFWRTFFCSLRLQQSCFSRHLRHGNFIFVREYNDNGTRSEPLYKTKTGYYEILEVSSAATQAQIKTAYYKQSFIYHPDRNASSDEATQRFSEISEAYMVLGNKGLRKKYDRGLLSLSDLTATVRPSKDTTGSSAKQQATGRRSVVGSESREGIFDFDKFFKSHYNEQLQRQRNIKVRKEEMLKRQQEAAEDMKLDKMLEFGVVLMLALAVGILLTIK